jgi:quercetin dioxygenase-like cupin family protein
MALLHAGSGERIVLDPGVVDFAQAHSVALTKTPHMELIRLVLQKGKAMPVHAVEGEISLQCLRGELGVDAHGRATLLHAGEMLFLSGGVPHAVVANQDSVALLTILLTH